HVLWALTNVSRQKPNPCTWWCFYACLFLSQHAAHFLSSQHALFFFVWTHHVLWALTNVSRQ
ncbi:hypothetical protein NDU88_006741, partial [Pleurodeles waltl]